MIEILLLLMLQLEAWFPTLDVYTIVEIALLVIIAIGVIIAIKRLGDIRPEEDRFDQPGECKCPGCNNTPTNKAGYCYEHRNGC